MKIAKKGFIALGLMGSGLVFAGIVDQFERSGVVWISPRGIVHIDDTHTSQRLWLFNPSGQKIELKTTPSCGCTVVQGPDSIPPYAMAPLDLNVDLEVLPSGYTRKDVHMTVTKGKEQSAIQILVDVNKTKENKK